MAPQYIKGMIGVWLRLGLSFADPSLHWVALRKWGNTWSGRPALSEHSLQPPYGWATDYVFPGHSARLTALSTTFTSPFRAAWHHQFLNLLEFFSLNEFASYFPQVSAFLGLLKSVSTYLFASQLLYVCMYVHTSVFYVCSCLSHYSIGLCL